MPTAIVLAVIAAGVTLQSVELRYRAGSLLDWYPDCFLFTGVPTTPLNLQKEKALLFSATVLDPVLADPVVRTVPCLSDPNNAESNLRKNLTVKSLGTSARIFVLYEDTDPEAAARVCNAVVDSYLRQQHVEKIRTSKDYGRWLEPEIKHRESEVEQARKKVETLSSIGYQPDGQVDERLESELTLAAQFQSQINEAAFQNAVLNARFREIEHRFETVSLTAARPLVRLASELKRDRDLQAAELEVLNDKYDELRREVEQFGGLNLELRFAQQELAAASDVLNKLRTRVAKLQTERLQGAASHLTAKATPPQRPFSWPPKQLAVCFGIAFFSPLMLGFLLGFRREN